MLMKIVPIITNEGLTLQEGDYIYAFLFFL